MARAAVKAKQQARAAAQPAKPARRERGRRRHAGGGNPNQALFFNRLRRQAKWMYVLLAVLFAITFAAVGVGSGSSGLDQLFNGIDLFGGSSAISKANSEIKKNPAKGWRDLAAAYEAKGDTASAIIALQQYVKIRPKDASAYSELGGLQLTQAQNAASDYQTAAAALEAAAPGRTFLPGGTLGKAIGTDPIQQAAANQASRTTQRLYQKAIDAYSQAVSTYKTLTKLRPGDPTAQFQLAQAAQTAGDYPTAIAAYRAYLELNPSTPQRKQIEKLIRQLGG
jgi:tetratricopeptide (TPR) repeat protein